MRWGGGSGQRRPRGCYRFSKLRLNISPGARPGALDWAQRPGLGGARACAGARAAASWSLKARPARRRAGPGVSTATRRVPALKGRSRRECGEGKPGAAAPTPRPAGAFASRVLSCPVCPLPGPSSSWRAALTERRLQSVLPAWTVSQGGEKPINQYLGGKRKTKGQWGQELLRRPPFSRGTSAQPVRLPVLNPKTWALWQLPSVGAMLTVSSLTFHFFSKYLLSSYFLEKSC